MQVPCSSPGKSQVSLLHQLRKGGLCTTFRASHVGVWRYTSLRRLNPASIVACDETSKVAKLSLREGLKGQRGDWREAFWGRGKASRGQNCGQAARRSGRQGLDLAVVLVPGHPGCSHQLGSVPSSQVA